MPDSAAGFRAVPPNACTESAFKRQSIRNKKDRIAARWYKANVPSKLRVFPMRAISLSFNASFRTLRFAVVPNVARRANSAPPTGVWLLEGFSGDGGHDLVTGNGITDSAWKDTIDFGLAREEELRRAVLIFWSPLSPLTGPEKLEMVLVRSFEKLELRACAIAVEVVIVAVVIAVVVVDDFGKEE
jgi:hypothetical protein